MTLDKKLLRDLKLTDQQINDLEMMDLRDERELESAATGAMMLAGLGILTIIGLGSYIYLDRSDIKNKNNYNTQTQSAQDGGYRK